MLSAYYKLAKPGIVYGNALTAAAGYFVGVTSDFQAILFLQMLCGISFIIAAGCVLNNVIDRDIDAKMERTKQRALVTGTIPIYAAILYACLLGSIGAICLWYTTLLSLSVALTGLAVYVIVYSLWSKRSTMHATIIGSIAGAVPPVVGYAASANTLDAAALILFLILFTWQVPHALAISIRRIEDYRMAGIPVLPLATNLRWAKIQLSAYAAFFGISALSLGIAGYAGTAFTVAMTLLSLTWFVVCLKGFGAKDDVSWAKQVFFFSLWLLLAFSALTALEAAVRIGLFV